MMSRMTETKWCFYGRPNEMMSRMTEITTYSVVYGQVYILTQDVTIVLYCQIAARDSISN